jgi:hypothetical protein
MTQERTPNPIYYAISELEHGAFPSYRAISSPDEPLNPGEQVIEELPGGRVWDGEAKSLREPTELERAQNRKPIKKRLLRRQADGKAREILPVTGQYASLARRQPNDPRITQADAIYDALDQKIKAVDAAQTIAELENITF